MDKFIDKILDNYYSRKLVNKIENCIRFTYDLDIQTLWEDNLVRVKIKNKKYKDDHYYSIFIFECDNALTYLIRFSELDKTLKHAIDYYLDNEKWR